MKACTHLCWLFGAFVATDVICQMSKGIFEPNKFMGYKCGFTIEQPSMGGGCVGGWRLPLGWGLHTIPGKRALYLVLYHLK